MSVLETIIEEGQFDAKMGQRCILTLGCAFILDVILGLCSVTTLWVILPLFILETICFFAIGYYLFGVFMNIFAVSRASSIYNGIQLDKVYQEA